MKTTDYLDIRAAFKEQQVLEDGAEAQFDDGLFFAWLKWSSEPTAELFNI